MSFPKTLDTKSHPLEMSDTIEPHRQQTPNVQQKAMKLPTASYLRISHLKKPNIQSKSDINHSYSQSNNPKLRAQSLPASNLPSTIANEIWNPSNQSPPFPKTQSPDHSTNQSQTGAFSNLKMISNRRNTEEKSFPSRIGQSTPSRMLDSSQAAGHQKTQNLDFIMSQAHNDRLVEQIQDMDLTIKKLYRQLHQQDLAYQQLETELSFQRTKEHLSSDLTTIGEQSKQIQQLELKNKQLTSRIKDLTESITDESIAPSLLSQEDRDYFHQNTEYGERVDRVVQLIQYLKKTSQPKTSQFATLDPQEKKFKLEQLSKKYIQLANSCNTIMNSKIDLNNLEFSNSIGVVQPKKTSKFLTSLYIISCFVLIFGIFLLGFQFLNRPSNKWEKYYE